MSFKPTRCCLTRICSSLRFEAVGTTPECVLADVLFFPLF
jgi:hypothetical protein